jgi:acetyl esterase
MKRTLRWLKIFAIVLVVIGGLMVAAGGYYNLLARTIQVVGSVVVGVAVRAGKGNARFFPDLPRNTREITIPTSVAPARAIVYLPPGQPARPPVYVNFHGGAFVGSLIEGDDPLCRYLAAKAGVAVVNVDYVVAPQHPFPAAPHQAYEVVRWVAEHGTEQGWDGSKLVVGGQSSGGGLAAAVARQALEHGGPRIALQVLHYPSLDVAKDAGDGAWVRRMMYRAYIPHGPERFDPLASPANSADTADLAGIALALVVTPDLDLLHTEALRYADRLRKIGALVELFVVPRADHGYDNYDLENASRSYALIASRVAEFTGQ